MSWEVEADRNWLSLHPLRGSSEGEKDKVTVSVDTGGLSPGNYQGTITISAPGAANTPQTVPVTLTVTAPPTLSITPASLAHSLQQGTGWTTIGTVNVTNPGGGTLSWSAADNRAWINISPSRGTTTIETDPITVRVTTTGLGVATHTGIITFTSTGMTRTVNITLTVTTAPPPTLSVIPASRDFGSIMVGQSENLYFTVTNAGTGILTGSASLPAGPFSIISGSPFRLGAGARTMVTVRFSPTVTGSFRETVAFISNGGNLQRAVSGVGIRPAPVLSVTPLSRDFGNVTRGQSRDLGFTVTNTGTGTLEGSASVALPFRIVAGSPFRLGTGASTSVTVRFSPTATGSFSDMVAFTSNGGVFNSAVSGIGVDPLPEPAANGCFIATAAHGTPLAEEVEVLRRLRDEHLLSHLLGRTLVSAYEKISPPLAEFIRRNPVLKSGVRIALRPLIWMSEKVIE